MTRLIDADALLEALNDAWEDNVLSTLGDAINIITNAPTVQREGWVSVEDRLPATGSRVWVGRNGKVPAVMETIFDGENFVVPNQYGWQYANRFLDPTHWKPKYVPAAPTDTEK